jgi:hypothetical protein
VKNKRMMPAEGWVPMANATAQNRRLSWRAKGLLVDLLSFPDGYDITFDRLIAMAKAAGDPYVEGRDAMRKAMQELEKKGYIAHIRHAVKDEGTERVFWRTETVVCDLPGVINVRGTGLQEAGDSGGRPSSMTEGQELSNNTVTYKNGEQDGLGKSSSALAAARAGQHADANDQLRPDLQRWYDAADKLSEERIRRHLLEFEMKRPQVYGICRKKALDQHKGRAGGKQELHSEDGPRMQDMLVFKYALLHYSKKAIPPWLVKLPR